MYKLVFTVVDPDGIVVEARSQNVGFRKVEFGKMNELLINGKSGSQTDMRAVNMNLYLLEYVNTDFRYFF